MKTLQAQRLKKQAEDECKHRREILEQIWEEAEAEAQKLEGLLTLNRGAHLKEQKQIFEEYREDDESVYFEEGFIER